MAQQLSLLTLIQFQLSHLWNLKCQKQLANIVGSVATGKFSRGAPDPDPDLAGYPGQIRIRPDPMYLDPGRIRIRPDLR